MFYSSAVAITDVCYLLYAASASKELNYLVCYNIYDIKFVLIYLKDVV